MRLVSEPSASDGGRGVAAQPTFPLQGRATFSCPRLGTSAASEAVCECDCGWAVTRPPPSHRPPPRKRGTRDSH
ncbi:hypothetical protein CHLRE_01g006876v5 [Chlamydomonas reinhardtii]|uniref:Uncharacterized protein n=1 Tax=Chlamydomonas reinhardtii TaxID=3055 RepID=A0A2K3E556_CHLRE|nr:uncharacterized protein CHLRE_01g006876v5 [Chlamydomonas reinhardtii]PNW87914.1 hypothetical protein CHLRE_01g006876v5 [Chlamydomonas reinhardtii]